MQLASLAPTPEDFHQPPRILNAEGRMRGVGVELEYAGLTAEQSALALAEALGGDDDAEVLDRLDLTARPSASGAMRADGNTVDVDREMASLSENALEYQALAQLAKARLHMIEIGIGGH